jgi:hypothetical protein
MRCYMCSKKIGFWGETCPYCGVDKSTGQSLRILSLVCLIGGFAVGAWLRGVPGCFVGGIIGLVAFVLLEKFAPKIVKTLRA